jgi:hypothetical protein
MLSIEDVTNLSFNITVQCLVYVFVAFRTEEDNVIISKRELHK